MRARRDIAACCLAVCLLAASGCGSEAEEIPLTPSDAPSAANEATAVTPTVADDPRCRLATADTAADCPHQGDGDHDGVDDGTDLCPDTTPGIEVDASGCALAVKSTDPSAI